MIHANHATVKTKGVLRMTDEAKAARNAYKREWYKRNREKQREYQERYWQRKCESKGKESQGIATEQDEKGGDGEC